jgi:hypothetical protein
MKKLYCLLIPLFLIASLSGAAEWVNLTGSKVPVEVTVLESTGDRILVNYQVNGFVRDQVAYEGHTYDFIGLAHESRLFEPSSPDLPRLCRSVLIPDDALMDAEIISAAYKDIENVRVIPSKGHLLRTVDPETVPYEFGEVYRQDDWYPKNTVELRDAYILRDFRGQVVELNSFQYNPVTQVLRVYTDITVEISQVGIGGANVLVRSEDLESMDPTFKGIYERHFINFDATDYTPVEEQGPMLVICHDPWIDAMMPLVDWKNQKGIPTTIVPVSQIGNNGTAIKNYINGEYNVNGLTWVLLVGDAAQVATYNGDEDPQYGMVTGGDAYFELFVGRFSAENIGHVETQVERTVEYERDPQLGAAWYHKGFGVASNQGAGIGHYGESDDEHMDLIRDQLLHYGYTEVDQIYDPYATSGMVSTALNEGRSIGNYCGHGSTTSWGSSGFSNTNVNNLVNDNMLPFITSVACLNGNFTGSTCFGEAWLRATNGGEPTGAIGFWGSTISQSWAPPMYAQDEAVDLLTPELKMTFGGLCFNGAMLMVDETGSTGASEAKHWTIFGDPSVQVWAKTPEIMSVSHNPEIDPAMTSFDVVVTGIEGALAAISSDGELFASAYTNASGLAQIPIMGSVLPPYVTLTVTAFNQAPYITQLAVVPQGPDTYPPLIAHVPMENTTSAGPYTCSAEILDYSGVAEATLYYSTDGMNFDSVPMANTIGDTWEGDIPGQTAGTIIDYYIEAIDASPQSNVGESETWSFTILAVLFADDMESGVGGWTHEGLGGWYDQWHLSTQNSHSPTHAWKFGDTGGGDYLSNCDGVLTSPIITIGDDSQLTFWHRIEAEQSGAYPDSAYDGGVVEISHNGGAWMTLPMAYTHTVRTTAGGGNPYTGPFPANTPLFSGSINWTQVNADLAAYVGDIQIRFRFGSDAASTDIGWFIDDVEIIGLPTGTLPDMDVELTYVSGSPVPEAGGNLYFDVFVENLDVIPLNFDAWLDITYEGGPPTTVIQRAFTNFQPGWSINRPNAFFPVPGSYAGGNYMMIGRVGNHPAVAWDESSFPWVKSGLVSGSGFSPFVPDSSFPNPFDIVPEPTTGEDRPEEFALGMYPNPFNPTTVFSYALPEAGQVTLKVYNLRGQLVEILVDGVREAGKHNVTFDASHLASGIYLYKLSAGSEVVSGKMVLVK